MSHLVSRSWVALILASTVAVSACSTSDTSGIRTRNSALVDTCINVTPTNNAPLIVADINSTCATAIVDINEFMYAEGGRKTGSPLDDQLNPSAQQLYFDHNFKEYTRGFEARKKNTPVEYVQVSGIGGEPSSMSIKTSVITEVQASDSCFIPDTDGYGVKMQDCVSMDKFLVTMAPTGTYSYQLFRTGVTTGGAFQPELNSPSTFYFSVLATKDGFPRQRMTIQLTEAQTFEYRFYSYSEPTTVFPYVYQFEDTGTPTTIPATSTTTPATTSPVDSVPTTVSETSTPNNTTEVSAPPTTGPINITALSQQLSDDCEQLNGVEVYPGISEWTDSTRFEINISNECMARQTSDDIEYRHVGHEMVATNSDTGRKVRFQFQGDTHTRISLNGRLPEGTWTISITQYATLTLPDAEPIISGRDFTVNVQSDPESQWKWCTKDDVTINSTQIVVDCDFTSAYFYLVTADLRRKDFSLNARGVPTDILTNISGWIPGGISFITDGYGTHVNLLFCSTNCGTLPSEIPTEVVRTSQGIMITPQKSTCESPLSPITGMAYLTQVNPNFIVHDPIVPDSQIDGALTSGITSIFPSDISATHILMIRGSDLRRSECTNTTFPGVQLSVVAIPSAVVTPSGNVQPVAASLPARIENLELARENMPGTPVVVQQGQTVLEIPARVVSSLTSSESVTSVTVQTADGTWRPLSSALSTFVPIDDSVTHVKVKYVFADGKESVVTKPLISADVYQKAIDASSSSSSGPLTLIVIMLALLAIVGGGFTFIRRKA